ATFGVLPFTVDAVASGDFTVNFPGFDGNADTDLLTGADTLAVGGGGSLTLTVTVTPGANLGPHQNTAVSIGTTPGNQTVTDDSDDNAVTTDEDGDGDPTNDNDPTPVTFGETPGIGVAKTVTSNTNNGDGTHTVVYTMLVENTGDTILNAVRVTDDLTATFGVLPFTVDAVASGDFTVNFPGFDGNADTDLLTGADTLAVGGGG
ncbi:MAG: hypothetical protein GY735_10225, partial [Delftia sp.]|nr:hypothetical protein [Delftia sp.]